LNGGQVVYAWVDYDPTATRLSVFLSNSSTKPTAATLTRTINLAATLGSRFFVGFTGGTGGATNIQEVLELEVSANSRLLPPPPDSGAFVAQSLYTGLTQPTSMEWTPDGRNLYIGEQRGVIRVVRDGVLLPTPLLDFRDRINGTRDRGLLDIAVHPNFADHPFVYLIYAYDPPEVNNFVGNANAGPDGVGNRAGRITRVTVDSSTNYTTIVPNSEIVLVGRNSRWENFNGLANSTFDFSEPPAGILPDGTSLVDFIATDSESHTVGALEFGPDGMLYATIGDGTSYNRVDPRTVRVQDVNNLSGKVLRIDPISGAGLASNPFFDGDVDSNRSKVYQLGVRNAFRAAFDDVTGRFYIGDVGWGTWEEINSAGAGANFGWPYYEGANGVNARTGGYQSLPEAAAFYASGVTATPAILALNHATDGINAIVVGDVYHGNAYPADYTGDLFFNDLGQGIVRNVSFNAAGAVTQVQTFVTGARYVVAMKQGPDGYLYYVDLDDGVVGRWILQ
jgi:glucose/arabinose dehydrogenase